MKKNTKRSVWLIWFPIGMALALFFLITFIGNILVIGTKLASFNPLFEIVFYGLLLMLSIWLIAIPIFGVLSKPVMALEDLTTGSREVEHKQLLKVALELVSADVLPVEQQEKLTCAIGLCSDIRGPMAEAVKVQIESSKNLIRSHAVSVFVATAVSQNGKLDAIAVLVANLRLVNSLVIHFGYRPPLHSLIAIYAQIFLATFVANEIGDLNTDSFLDKVGLGVVSAIPGSSLIVNLLFDGSINAMFTLRVGFLTRKYLLNAGKEMSKSDVQKNANLEARQELIPVVKESLPALPAAIQKLVQAIL